MKSAASDGERMIKVGSIEDGVVHRDWYRQGYVFKDEHAFLYDPQAPCYVPELGDEVYTSEDLLSVAAWDWELTKEMFYDLDWQSPETWMDEYEREEMEEDKDA